MQDALLTNATELKTIIYDVLVEAGLVSPFITRQEIIAMLGRHRYEKAVRTGLITRCKGEGRNASVRIKRSEFSTMLQTGKI